MRVLRLAFIIFLLMAMPASAGDVEIPSGALCSACGMLVEPGSPFASVIVDKGKALYFCDIGDMLSYYAALKGKPDEVHVKDYEWNLWMDGYAAFYVKGEYFKSPMGWRIAAFKKKPDADNAGKSMTFKEALAMVSASMSGKHNH